ncbi:MAG: colanic acid biosynthesis glycosyltransferase WcaL [Elainellaceae cyanobacterium]
MKIAFIVGQFPVLSETFILNQITGLIDRGHEVDIYADRAGDLLKLHEDVVTYKLLDRTYYLPEIPANHLWRVIKGCGLLCSNLMQAPRDTLRSLNVLRYGEQTLSLWLLYTLIPNFQKDYDIIHCQFGTVSFRGMAFRTVNAPNAKLITIFRGHDISYFVKEKGEKVYDALFKQGDYFLANCEFFKRRAIDLGCPPDKIRVHGSGLDYSRFPFQIRQFPEDGIVRIATTGRLVEKKGIEYSIRAVAQVLKQYPNLEYTIIGEGPLRSNFEQLIQSLGVERSIKLLGRKSQAELIALLETSHLFIAPSVTAADGNQDAPVNVLKEAMAMGLPVISTLHGGIPELVEEGVSGYLVPERDAEAIATRLVDLIEHPDRWAAMGQAGRAFVEQNYDLNRLNDALVSLYESLLRSDLTPRSEVALSLS